MKALSIKQPWAWLIINQFKDIENRNWNTNYRGDFLVHASKSFDEDGYNFVKDNFPNIILPNINKFKLGGILGKVTLIDVVESSKSKWFFGKYGYVLDNPVKCKFIPCNGNLSFWNFNNKIEWED